MSRSSSFVGSHVVGIRRDDIEVGKTYGVQYAGMDDSSIYLTVGREEVEVRNVSYLRDDCVKAEFLHYLGRVKSYKIFELLEDSWLRKARRGSLIHYPYKHSCHLMGRPVLQGMDFDGDEGISLNHLLSVNGRGSVLSNELAGKLGLFK